MNEKEKQTYTCTIINSSYWKPDKEKLHGYLSFIN